MKNYDNGTKSSKQIQRLHVVERLYFYQGVKTDSVVLIFLEFQERMLQEKSVLLSKW